MRILMLLLTLGWAVDLSGDLTLIDELNECMSARFQDPSPNALGMGRVAMPPSFGKHYQPFVTRDRDFQPENGRETKALAALEARNMQVGFYLFGRAVAEAKSEELYYRALKGPGAITIGTPRAAWYPGSPGVEGPDGRTAAGLEGDLPAGAQGDEELRGWRQGFRDNSRFLGSGGASLAGGSGALRGVPQQRGRRIGPASGTQSGDRRRALRVPG